MTRRKPGARRGCPDRHFGTDPHRYLLALSLSLQRTFGLSEQRAFWLVAAMVLGRKTGEKWCEPRRRPGVGNIPAGIEASYQRVMRIGGVTASFANYASTLRKKLHRTTNRASLRWLDMTGFGISAFLSTGIWLG
jgi:hypothetical protein